MTAQVPDTCIFDGRRWEIEDCGSLLDLVPSSESLGFRTVPRSTANWSGRIDHFLVYQSSLYLHRIEVNLDKDYRHFIPKGAGKELVIRYEPMTRTDANGTRKGWWKHKFVYFVFGMGDLRLDYTGKLALLYPHIDLWEIPAIAGNDTNGYEKRAVLTFCRGTLVEEHEEDAF